MVKNLDQQVGKSNLWRHLTRWILLAMLAIAAIAYFHPGIRHRIEQHIDTYYENKPRKQAEIQIDHRIELLDGSPHLSSDISTEAGFDWPQFRGPNRDGISHETQFLQKWPAKGPDKLFTIRGIGQGYSSPAIHGEYLVITGEKAGRSLVYCLTTNGQLIWHQDNGPSYESYYAGTRSTPTIEEGRVYAFSANGRIGAFDLKTGREYWNFLIEEEIIEYGLAESVLVYGNKLICTPGSVGGEVIALDKYSGKVIWRSNGNNNDMAGYGSPLLIESLGRKQILATLHSTLVSLDPDNGEQLWTYDKPFRKGEFRHGRICMMPVVVQDKIFLMGGERCGGGAIQMQLAGDDKTIAITELWSVPRTASHFGGYVAVDGNIYGSDGKGWLCRDFISGKEQYRLKTPKKASTIFADNHFICVEEQGNVYLIEATPENARIVSHFKIAKTTGGKIWARPCISRGRLYIRDSDQLHVYKIRER